MRVSEIWVYPIKGLGGVQVETSDCLISGLEYDRRIMLIDESDTFISQRSHPNMATLGVELDDNTITVYKKNKKAMRISFDMNELSAKVVTGKVWKSQVSSIEFPIDVNNWFSNVLGDSVRLIKQSKKLARTRTLPFSPRKIDLSFADGYPYLFLSRASVNQLNSEISHHVDIRQFRANIILDECEAFEEDQLDQFQVGKATFRMVKPCKRCPVININQDTGESNKATTLHLSKTRRSGNGIIFGMNAAILHESSINIDDRIAKI